jgi:FSR family fosmidomycin resistance protein-like MFS transporter
MISGLFFGLAFGMGGLGAAVLGIFADHTSIDLLYKVCAFLPALGLFTAFLPDLMHDEDISPATTIALSESRS